MSEKTYTPEEVKLALTEAKKAWDDWMRARDAAPYMLDALKTAKELADVMEGLSGGRSDDEWIWAAQAKINAAIAKAEGKP